MAKSSGSTRTNGSRNASQSRTFTQNEVISYFAQQRVGTREAFARGRMTERQYRERMADLEKRERTEMRKARQ